MQEPPPKLSSDKVNTLHEFSKFPLVAVAKKMPVYPI